ncbi:MAG: 50S ribosomal protein L7ae [Firmicutes bacterium]|nr:50S ribosomal protein L7ae [Bacillota bacterium]
MKFLSLLGIAQAAGRLASGNSACEEAFRRDRVHLLIFAQDASDNVKRKFSIEAARKGVPTMEIATKESLGKAIGKPDRAVIAVCDPAFAKALVSAAESD